MPLSGEPREPNQDAQHLPYLDRWRGVAILLVLAAHFNDWPVGGVGVTLFFALSGVLMTRILFVQRTPLKVFYLRRAARILPAFWLYVLVVFVTWKFVFDRFDGLELVTTLTFLRTYVPAASILHSAFPIGQIWSLNVEEHSYVLLSLLSIPAARRGNPFAAICLFVLAGLCVLCFLYYKVHPQHLQSLFHLRTEVAALPLLLSGAIYLLKRQRQTKKSQVGLCLVRE
jgi:peptidoglycan/LPS O-acetylase OafA/YrhL